MCLLFIPQLTVQVKYRTTGTVQVIPVLWIRIRKDPKLFAGSGSETGDAPYQKSSKNHQRNKQFDNYDIKKRKSNIFFKKYGTGML
jgi:hypothetical protein